MQFINHQNRYKEAVQTSIVNLKHFVDITVPYAVH